jgi:hypothetical protein
MRLGMIQVEEAAAQQDSALPPVSKAGASWGGKAAASDVAAVDLWGQLVDERAQALDERMQRE